MKYLGYLIILMCVLFVLSLAHNLLLNKLWYRWIVNSIIYPINALRLNKKTYFELIEINCNWILHDKWFHKFWFGRKLKKIMNKKLEKNLPDLIDNFN